MKSRNLDRKSKGNLKRLICDERRCTLDRSVCRNNEQALIVERCKSAIKRSQPS